MDTAEHTRQVAHTIRQLIHVIDNTVAAHMDTDDIVAAETPLVARAAALLTGTSRDPDCYTQRAENVLMYSPQIDQLIDLVDERDWEQVNDTDLVDTFTGPLLNLEKAMRTLDVEPR